MTNESAGRLFYVMGASGVGKDSLLSFVRQAGDPRQVAVAHRYITRPPQAAGENHIALSEAEFRARLGVGWFALHWSSHGFSYAIGREIDIWRRSGVNVVVNGSREYLPEALEAYPDLVPVLITAEPALIAGRLAARKRESKNEIAERLRARDELDALPESVIRIDNSGAIERAGSALLALVTATDGAISPKSVR
ncbi:ribose 1,5-bisphosphate phosphokinase PhnN [Hypericibacter terrae]|uniref:Ribose 1,5-bisphosphate phosphokinase PhnN n=1 Tax=Hypericibacter terrae TaxID=2602015 RepID=A0A5J6MJY4_9PROT|nr:phosphonate metabolism protein/1,5-bisphosphokinase (PRPP-forming) PhnN [Hypericibacter terrae]QEX17511.1 ribose 1,5-bisphosphate phosphokinase PhnN [Hypericibacter terrae]